MLWTSWEKPNLSRVLRKTPCTRMHKVLWKWRGKPIVGEGPETVLSRSEFDKDTQIAGKGLKGLLDAFLRPPEKKRLRKTYSNWKLFMLFSKDSASAQFAPLTVDLLHQFLKDWRWLKSTKRFNAVHTELIPRNHFGGNQIGTIRNSPGIWC